MSAQNYRYYGFGNFYLSSIQQGIQAAHVITKMAAEVAKHKSDESFKLADEAFITWANTDYTMILLNGGMARDVLNGYNKVATSNLKFKQLYTAEVFFEEPGAIDHNHSSATAWGIILPEAVWGAVKVEEPYSGSIKDGDAEFMYRAADYSQNFYPGSLEHTLLEIIRSCQLAR